MLLLVEDANDNSPVFTSLPTPVEVAEHVAPQPGGTVIARFRAEDKDSGAFGQVCVFFVVSVQSTAVIFPLTVD